MRQQAKASANWRCQNPTCQRDCLRPGESLGDLIGRMRQHHLLALWEDLNPPPKRSGYSVQPFIMKAVSDGNGGYLALCGSCAIQFVQPSPQPSFVQTKLELLGQLRLL